MILSKETFAQAAKEQTNLLHLPEKVLQFGTGVLLRGLPDYFIHNFNLAKKFNGRIAVVKSTEGDKQFFENQNNLFTHCIRGLQHGDLVRKQFINASISRVLLANQEWEEVLKCASNPELQLIISNTTEAGIVLVEEDIFARPPASFPGKLAAFLHRRYKAFEGAPSAGMVIIPTELIVDNADKLLSVVRELARQNKLESDFIKWLENANEWCNSLVDCIVPGMPMPAERKAIEEETGYSDDLMIMSEPYRLWAVQSTSGRVAEMLDGAEGELIVAPDISRFREMKLRLLNGTHTFCCGLAYLAGLETVTNAMKHAEFKKFAAALMHEEIIPSMTSDNVPKEEAEIFAEKVLTRFSNPYIQHKWISITVQYSSKMNMRNFPLIKAYLDRRGAVPPRMALAFAAHLLFMKSSPDTDGKFYGAYHGQRYPIADVNADFYCEKWQSAPLEIAPEILKNEKIWSVDLTPYPDFIKTVAHYLEALKSKDIFALINETIK